MKIAYYIDTVIPTRRANMVHVMKMCQAFSDLGHEVTLLCDSSEKYPDLEAIRREYSVTKRFRIQTVCVPTHMRKYGHRLSAYYGAWKKARLNVECDVMYSRSAAALFWQRHRCRYIYEAHMDPDILNRQIESRVLKHKNCVGLVVISAALKKKYLEIFPFLKEEKITVLHDAADMVVSDLEMKAELRDNESPIIGYVGHLYPGKCMETLLPLAKRCPQYQFHIVGGTEEWLAHWKAKAEHESIYNLIFYGYVDNCRVGEFYRAFDIVILPFSQNIQIGKSKSTDIGKWISPLKLFEAMAYGKSIIVSGLETIAEVMEDGKDCVMVEPDNIDDWVEKLNRLCTDADLRGRIGAAARDKLKNEYTWRKRAALAADLFD